MDKETKQPSIEEIKAAVVFFPGPVVTYRGFKQSAWEQFEQQLNKNLQQPAPTYPATAASLAYVYRDKQSPRKSFSKQRQKTSSGILNPLKSAEERITKPNGVFHLTLLWEMP